MLSIFLHQNLHTLDVPSYFLSFFEAPHQNALFEQAWRIVVSEVNAHWYDWLKVVNV